MCIGNEIRKQADMKIAKAKYPEMSEEEAYDKLQDDIAEYHKAQMPGLKQQAINFTSSMSAFARSSFKLADNYEERLEICRACPYLTKNNRCVKCGCFVQAKAKIKVMTCPEGKW